MAGTSTSFAANAVRSTAVELSRTTRCNSRRSLLSLAGISSSKSRGGSVSAITCDEHPRGPYCIYVGPIDTASKETLEALYSQARDAYYSGEPLIIDDMFDRVELKLRWYGSKSVVKYPRCSIRRQSTYSDAEEDLSMVFALASTWALILAFGCSACIGPIWYTVSMAYQTAFNPGSSYGSKASGLEFLFTLNGFILMALGFAIGYPIASASVKALQSLWRNGLVALKGTCPNCGEEVFAFVTMDKANDLPHRSKCHVCECLLEFLTKVEKSSSRFGRQWVHGRIYLVRRSRRRREL
ncbi:hypothetical protein HN51_019081 [Arachis hypogaea]|uniref:PGR5-like protein n=2 Tax=Arachis TaxID=3817 RepID=A0A445BVZ3_ARAHY|nr:uncharacterized protein LOC107461661 [Arachis duranensis]XP_025613907.1 uncharacterized protein LOC112706696 isoform X2 [Arachis hypogaea]QHO30633.1 PGR5-like protein 1B [Arachis hypogaea]RYR42728.1 hypothetical protein Ahy_A08g039175 isoform A [Arachis hypogaea]